MFFKSKKILIPRIFGGLGNQLYIYAAARRLSYINNSELVLDHRSGFKFDKRYNRKYQLDHFNIKFRKATPNERFEPFSLLRRYSIRKWNNNKIFYKSRYLMDMNNSFDPRILNYKIKKKVYMEGYWQDENYFKDIDHILREDLKIIPPLDQENIKFSKKISSYNSIAIHLRFFDNSNKNNINNVAISYYKKAIEKMENMSSDTHYFIFSDKPDQVGAISKIINNKMTIIEHNKGEDNAYADFWLMSQCDHFIIANSTFSWWASWLNNSPNKVIFSPEPLSMKKNTFVGSSQSKLAD